MPAVVQAPPAVEETAPEEAASQASPAGEEPPAQGEAVAASAEAEVVQRNLAKILNSFKNEDDAPEESGTPLEDPFAGPEESGGDMEATRILNLDDLQFGSNYKRER